MIVRPYDPEKDLGLLYTSTIRAEDSEELMASTGAVVDTIIKAALLPSADTYVVLTDDGQLITIGGLASSIDGVGVPWMVSTDLLDKHVLSVIKSLKPILKRYLDSHYYLMNFVDVRNQSAMKFLLWLGFVFPHDQGYSMGGTFFQAFIQRGGKQDV